MIGVLDLPLEGEGNPANTPSFYQRIVGHAPSVSSRCVSTMKGIVLPSFISLNGMVDCGAWKGAGVWILEVHLEFTQPRNM